MRRNKFKVLYTKLGELVNIDIKNLPNYKKYYLKNENYYFSFIKKIIKPKPEDKILDIGTGTGLPMYVIGIKKYIGIDISPTVLKIARNIFKKPKFITMDATKRLKFEDEYFDYVFCLETIEHLPKEGSKHLLKEIHRILKPGGKLIIATPNKFKWLFFPLYYLIPEYYRPDILRLFRLISKEEYITYKRDLITERHVGITQHINMYSLRRLIKELNTSGFKIFIIKEFGTILDYKYFKKLKILRLFGFIKKFFPKDRILVIAKKE